MKKKKNKKTILLVCIFISALCIFIVNAYSKYVGQYKLKANYEYVTPYFEIENQEVYEDVNKAVCNFKVRNYLEDTKTDCDLKYYIELENLNPNMVVKLYKDNELVSLDNFKSEEFTLQKDFKQENSFKIEVEYKVDNEQDIDEYMQNVNICLKSYQI